MAASTDPARTHRVRQFVQENMLASLHRAGAFQSISFVGGTALRLLYGSPRYSLDLDFVLDAQRSRYDPESWLRVIKRELSTGGIVAEVKLDTKRTVHTAKINVRGLLHRLGLSPMANSKVQVNIEVDTNPPEGGESEESVPEGEFHGSSFILVRHHNLSSMMAGKVHALTCRPFVKERDWFDFAWYRARRITPNLEMLGNAVLQTEKKPWSPDLWKNKVRERLHGIEDYGQVIENIGKYLDEENREIIGRLKDMEQMERLIGMDDSGESVKV
jgi:hypothetical protein